MTNKIVYKKCNELFRSIDMQDKIDKIFLSIEKTSLPNILAEPDDNNSIPQLILSNVFRQLSEEFNPSKMNHKELREVVTTQFA